MKARSRCFAGLCGSIAALLVAACGSGGVAPAPSPTATPTPTQKATPVRFVLGDPLAHHLRGADPTIVASGPDQVGIYTSDPNGANSGDSCSNPAGGPVIQNVHLVLIFWGSDWNPVGAGTHDQPSQSDIVNRINRIISSSYLDQLAQYGFQTIDIRDIHNDFSQPPNNYTTQNVGDEVMGLIDNGTYPEPDYPNGDNLYVVFTSPSVSPAPLAPTLPAGGGWHGSMSDADAIGSDEVIYARVSYSNIDGITSTFTHELVESISDPQPHDSPAWLMDRNFLNTTGENEIGDACNNMSDFLDAVFVQSYFSQALHACVIPFPAPPTITSINPSAGPIAGGQTVVVNGSGFDTNGATVITVGGQPTKSKCTGPGTCQLTTPPSPTGAAEVTPLSVKVNQYFGAQVPYQYGPVIPSCTASFACSNYSGATTVKCPLGGSGATLALTRLNPSTGHFDVLNDPPSNVYGATYFTDYDSPPANTQLTYEVRATNANGVANSAPLVVTATDCTCHASLSCTDIAAQCGTVNNGCGVMLNCGSCDPNSASPVCSNHHCCPSGQTWDDTQAKCVVSTATCTTPAQCCAQSGGSWNGNQCL